jgi:small subunit ribosomal protein S11
VSIFAPTPTAALPDSAGYRAEAPAPSTPPGPSPLPRTFSWHAAQTDRAITPMPEMAALVKDAARPGLGRSGDGLISPSLLGSRGADEHREPFHLHIFAHRHNTHVTLSRPNRDAIISVSCGNLGFRKSKRKHYDAAYQLTQHVLQLIEKKQLLEHIHGIEVILSGFGQGREAAAKVLLSSEGSRVKEKIVRVSDASKIKFGGTRSRNPRRV